MRILHIVRQFSPAIGGLENFVQCLAAAQLAAGHQPVVLTLNTVFHQDQPALASTETIHGIPVRRVPWRGSSKYPIAPSVASHLKGYDIIHVHAVDFFADFLPLLRPWHKTPMVLSTHGGFFHSSYASRLKKIFFNTVTRWSVRGYNRVIACSEGDHAMFLPLCQPWLRLIENGVDIEKFADLGAPAFARRLLFIGRFSDNKRLDLLLQTLHHLKQLTPDVRLTIIGRDWDGNLQKIQQQITDLALQAHVSVLLNLDDSAIQAQVAQHCFIASASDYEGFGMTLIEGMAAGLVPLASPISSFKKIVELAGVGHLVDFHAPEAAAGSIYAYMQGLQTQYPEARAQCMRAAASYGWQGTAAKFTQVYEEVLGTRVRHIQGVPIDTRSGREVIQAIEQAIEQREVLHIAIANAHTVNLARQMPEYCELLARSLVLNDGAGVNIASKWKYRLPFSENLNGTDFVPRLLATTQRQLRVFLVGARPDVVQHAFQQFAQRYPQHQWLGYQDGFIAPADETAVCNRIRATAPDLLLVAMGNPLQEKWIARCAGSTGASVCIGVGALFDFTAGQVNRAPQWVRQIKCEWVYRLLQEPGRMWRRYLVGNLTFLWAASRDKA